MPKHSLILVCTQTFNANKKKSHTKKIPHEASNLAFTYEPRHEKTNVLHMRKQRRGRSASR